MVPELFFQMLIMLPFAVIATKRLDKNNQMGNRNQVAALFTDDEPGAHVPHDDKALMP